MKMNWKDTGRWIEDLSRLKKAQDIIKHFLEFESPCTCHEAYKDRGMIAPDCHKCNGPDYEAAKLWLAEFD